MNTTNFQPSNYEVYMNKLLYIIDVDSTELALAASGKDFYARFNDAGCLKDQYITPDIESDYCLQVIEEFMDTGMVRKLSWVTKQNIELSGLMCSFLVNKMGWFIPGSRFVHSHDKYSFRPVYESITRKEIVTKQEIEIEGKKFLLNITLDPV